MTASTVTGYPFDGYDGTDGSFDTLTADMPPSGAESPVDGPGVFGDTGGMKSPQRPAAVNRGGTDEDGKVPCAAGCGTWVTPGSKTGRCRPCVREMWRSGELRHTREGKQVKTDPRERAAMLTRMLAAAARRAVAEDPGQGLAILLDAQQQVDALAREVGTALLAQYQAETDDGLTRMAEDLTLSRGELWSKQRVYKRWGGNGNG